MSKKIVTVGDIRCGSEKLFLISGPCVIESGDVMKRSAETLADVQSKLGIPVIFKASYCKDNRSSLSYYKGPGLEEGLKILEGIKKEFGFPILTDIHYSNEAAPVGEVCDVLQIPAYLCMQSGLLEAASKTGKVINIKHGQFLAPENMKYPAGKCKDSGNDNIILTERGFTMGYNDLVVDPRSFYLMGQLGYPVVFDITHSIRKYGIPSADAKGGNREFLPTLSRAGVAAGVDGIFVETHPTPSSALCDAASQLTNDAMLEFLKPLLEIHNLVTNAKKTYTEAYYS